MGCIPSKCRSSHVAAAAGGSPETTQLRHILTHSAVGSSAVPPHGLLLRYASLTQRGFYPDSPERENQDTFLISPDLQGNPSLHLFAVFDGHGIHGGRCSAFARQRLPQILAADPRLPHSPAAACAAAFPAANADLRASDVDDSMSGTTAVSVLVSGKTLTISNVGDSRAVAGLRKGNSVVAEDLSSDQTPFRIDECSRVKLAGARVLTVAQVEGITDPSVQTWGKEEDDDGDPPRVWVQEGMYPGTAFTRSLGDSIAEKIGVVADPEILQVEITSEHLFFVLASDGVFEFLSSQAVVDMVAKFADPRDACSAVAAESYRRWLEHETRTDDITIIVVQIKDMFGQ